MKWSEIIENYVNNNIQTSWVLFNSSKKILILRKHVFLLKNVQANNLNFVSYLIKTYFLTSLGGSITNAFGNPLICGGNTCTNLYTKFCYKFYPETRSWIQVIFLIHPGYFVVSIEFFPLWLQLTPLTGTNCTMEATHKISC